MHQTITPMPHSTAPGHHLFSVSGFASPGYCLCQLKKKKRCKKKKKDVQLESCELSFIWGKMRTAAQEAASQKAAPKLQWGKVNI